VPGNDQAQGVEVGGGGHLLAGDAREALGRARNLLGEDAAHGGEDVGLRRGQAAELEGQARDPLPLDVSGHTLAVGSFSDPTDFGNGILHSYGPNDLFVVRFGP